MFRFAGGVGQIFDVALVRGAWGAVERKEKLFIIYEELHKLIKMDATKDQLESKLNMAIRYIRCQHDSHVLSVCNLELTCASHQRGQGVRKVSCDL